MALVEVLSADKRAQILRGAATIFAEDGYEGASMSRIAAEAGVSKGTLYNHFCGKAELFAAYVSHECSANIGHIFEVVDEAADPAATLRGIGRRMIGMMLSPIGQTIYRVVVSEAGKFPQLARVFYDAGPAQGIDHLARWLAAQSRLGRLDVADPEFAAEQFFSLCQTRVWMRCKLNMADTVSPALIERVVEAAVEMFLGYYARKDEGSVDERDRGGAARGGSG